MINRRLSFAVRRPLPREILIFLTFLGLTVLMTWPWTAHLRDAVSDRGDPYLNAWILWWDYHQTFNDPLNLFHANIFYPYRYTLAFSENNYGIALPFFPLFALGVAPLTVHSVATLAGFALSGYGMFRLARTLTGANGAAWVAGIAFAFIPFRFEHLPHLNYLSAGWIPLLLEALVLFARERSWRRAVWLGATFLMNALSCIHWFVLTLIPFGVSAMFLLTRQRAWADRAFWLRSGVALGLAALLLLPFLIPYARAAELYGFSRTLEEAAEFSASPAHWLVASPRHQLWHGFGRQLVPNAAERTLFPGLLIPLLGLAALLMVGHHHHHQSRPDPESSGERAPPRWRRWLLVALDALALLLLINALFVTGHGSYRLQVAGVKLFSSSDAARPLLMTIIVLLARWSLAYPHVLRRGRDGAANLVETIRSERRSNAFWLGVLWAALGFCGSLGINFFFHHALYQTFGIFHSIRVPARWAMIGYVGLTLLAGLGAQQLAERLAAARHRPAKCGATIYAALALLLLFELRAAPLGLVRGEAEPDELTQWLRATPMQGGVVELPISNSDLDGYFPNVGYVLRAADHGRPLVNGYSGFEPPLTRELESLTKARPVPAARLFALLESIPASYLVVHNSYLTPPPRRALESALRNGTATGRLRFIRSYGADARTRQDLYAITRTEPDARGEAPAPEPFPAPDGAPQQPGESLYFNPIDASPFYVRQQYLDLLGREPGAAELNEQIAAIEQCRDNEQCRAERRADVADSLLRSDEMRATGFFLYRLFAATLDRRPTTEEFAAGMTQLRAGGGQMAVVNQLMSQDEWRRRYSPQASQAAYVERLFRSAQVQPTAAERAALVNNLDGGKMTRAEAAMQVADHPAVLKREADGAYVVLQYFGFLRRGPEPDGFQAWLRVLRNDPQGHLKVITGLLTSAEYRSRFAN